MNETDRQQFEEMKSDMQEVKIDLLDIHICQNDLCEKVDTIANNHLAHIKTDIQVLKSQLSLVLKVVGWGLAGLAILITALQLCG